MPSHRDVHFGPLADMSYCTAHVAPYPFQLPEKELSGFWI